jgi:membrane protein required for colicin V production
MNTASPLDWVLAILLATSVLFGLRRGFVRTLIGVLSLILGNVLAALYYVQIGERLAQLVPQLRTVPYLPAVLGYVVVVFSVMLAASLTGRFLRGAARVAGLGTVDRVLGGLFGLARGTLLGVTLLIALGAALPWTVRVTQAKGSGGPATSDATAPPVSDAIPSSSDSGLLENSQLAPYFLGAAHAVSFVVPEQLARQVRDQAARYKHTSSGWIKP